jgi:hypothetical protein
VAPFAQKTFSIFSSQESDPFCSWNDAGDTIIVKDVAQFSMILPKFFKHSNFQSFVRQLNIVSGQLFFIFSGTNSHLNYCNPVWVSQNSPRPITAGIYPPLFPKRPTRPSAQH